MDNVRSNEAAALFVSLWGNNAQAWNPSQHVVAAKIYKLFLETTTTTESNLIERIDQLVLENPEACEEGDRSGDVQQRSKQQRISRLRIRVAYNVHYLQRGEALKACKVKTENLRMEELFGSVHDRLAKIHDCQQLLHTKLTELNDTLLSTRVKDEALGWNTGTSPEDEEQLLTQYQQALQSLEPEPFRMKQMPFSDKQVPLAVQTIRRRLGANNAEIAKGGQPTRYRGTVDMTGSRAKHFQDLLSTQDRQFELMHMLAELDDEDVEDNYMAFAKGFADVWTRDDGCKWSSKDCDRYATGLIKQENSVSEALERKRQYNAATQPYKNLQRPQTAGKSSRNSQPSHHGENQPLRHQAQARRPCAETSSLPESQPNHTKGEGKQFKGSLNSAASRHNGIGAAAHGSIQGTASHIDQRASAKPARVNVSLDLAGSIDNSTSRHLRWSRSDTRDIFFHKVVELFPDSMIRQVSVRMSQGSPVNVQATGPEWEWEMVQEEWLKRLEKPSKKLKETSAEVHLVEATEWA